MHPSSPRASSPRRSPIATLAASTAWSAAGLLLVATLSAQTKESQAAVRPESGPAFPSNLLPVGDPEQELSFELGLNYQEAADLADDVFPDNETKRGIFLAALQYELGKKRVEMPAFFLAKNPVTNAQYKIFVEQTGHRFPFHWWWDGRKDDAISPERTEAMRNIDKIDYWKENWQDLPWAIPKDQENCPVVYLAWKDAIAYAAWAGCRLPTEAEWLYAMTGGDPERNFVWGEDWDLSKLKEIEKADLAFRLLPVGATSQYFKAPFGHEDVPLQVFEWTYDPVFLPFSDSADWREQLDRLKRTSEGRDVEFRTPEFGAFNRIIKGGSYQVLDDARLARLQTRVGVAPETYKDAIGVRLAKSYAPGRDHAEAALRLDYAWNYFGGNRRPNYDDHVGAERYDLGEDGTTIRGYYAVSIVPVSHYAEADKPRLSQFKEATQASPAIIGTLATSMPLKTPALEAGFYTLCFRQGGMTKDLSKALKEAQRDIAKARKANEDPPNGDWREQIRKYGLTDDEVLEHGSGIPFVRLNPGNLQVPVDQTIYAVRDNAGNYCAWFPAKEPGYESGYDNGDATIEVSTIEESRTKEGGEQLMFSFGVPQYEDSRGKVIRFELPILLSTEHAGGASWRLPTPAR
jgi:formylglycine-generating enzyme required for sulfatase activity